MSGQQKSQQFAEVVEAHYERIFRAALSLTRDRHLAEEIVQETFVSAFRKFDGFSFRSSVFTWLYRIMLNNCCKHWRRESLHRRLGLLRADANPVPVEVVTSRFSSPSEELANSEERGLMARALNALPAKLRVVVAMHYFDGLPLNEIAQILGCRLGTVKSRLFNARKRLCRVLQREFRYGCEEAMPNS